MSSETITKNDLKAILDAIMPFESTTTQTITTFSSGWTVYDSSSTVTLKKNGHIVSLTGALKNTAAVTLSSEGTKVFTLPEAFIPAEARLVGVYLASGANRYGMSVYGSASTHPGGVYFERCTNSTSFSSMAANSWFPFHMTWILG